VRSRLANLSPWALAGAIVWIALRTSLNQWGLANFHNPSGYTVTEAGLAGLFAGTVASIVTAAFAAYVVRRHRQPGSIRRRAIAGAVLALALLGVVTMTELWSPWFPGCAPRGGIGECLRWPDGSVH